MESSVAFVQARSTFMRERHRLLNREISEIRNRLGVNTGRLTGWIDEALRATSFGAVDRQRIADSYFFLIQRLQMVADLPTWLGQYEKSRAAGEPEARAIAIADEAVRDTQASGEVAHLATVQRGGPALKLWINFYSFFSTTYNLTIEATRRTNFRQPGHVGRLAVDYLLLFAVPASLGYLIREALRPDSDDDEALLVGLIRENLGYLSGLLLGFREVGGALQGF